MKKLLSLIMGVTMAIFLCTGCGKKQEESKPYTVGTITDGIYKNESLNLKYTKPENMTTYDSATLQETKTSMWEQQGENLKLYFSDLNVEFVGLLQSDSPVALEIVSYKLADNAKNTSENEFIKELTKYSEKDKDTQQTQKIGDTEFHKVANIKSNNLNMTLFSKKFNDYFVMIYAIAPDDETANKVLAGFSKLSE